MPVKVGLQIIEKWKESLEEQVLAYEQETVEQGKIVFYGPSYFTRWSQKFGMMPLKEVLVGESGQPCCVNRGFGSSCAEHHLYYYPRMVRALAPKVLVYASHGNGGSFGYSNEETWELAQRVIQYALTDFPDIHIYLTSAHPTKNMSDEEIEGKRTYNKWVKEFAENTPRCSYVDVFEYEPLRAKDNFIDDGVHFNAKGYQIYGEFFKEILKDELIKY